MCIRDSLESHPALAEELAVAIDGRHGEHLALLDLALEGAALDGDVLDARVEHAHRVERLHDVGAVLAGQRHVGLEAVFALDGPHRVGRRLGDLRRHAPDLQDRQDEGGELVPHRQPGEPDRDLGVLGVTARAAHQMCIRDSSGSA